MAHLIRMPRAAWRRQPTYDIELDSNSPYSSGVVNIISGHLGNSLQSVTGNSITKTGTGSVDPFVLGAGVGSRFGDALGDTYFTTPVKTESISGLSVFWLGSLKDDGTILRDHTNTLGQGTFVHRESGNLRIRFAGDHTNTTNISSWPTGDKTIMFTRRNGNIFVFDGVNHLSFGNTGSFGLVSPWYFHRNGSFRSGVNATTCLAIIWDKFVDPVGFVENPWQIFKPRPARFILIPSGGGSYSITASLDALLQKSFASSTSLDALLQSTFASTINLDALVAAVGTGTLSVDALLQATQSASVSVDALLRATKTSTISVDALLQLTLSSALDFDALLQAVKTGTVSLDALLTGAGGASVVLDALIQSGVLTTLNLDALIQATKTGAISLDALITGASGTLATVNLDALIQALQAKTLSLDALIQGAYTSTVALDAYIALVGVRSVSMDALIQTVNARAISLDALVQMTKGVSVSFDALIQQAKTGLISLDAILILATSASVWLDACVQRSLTARVSLDAIIGTIADMILPTGRVIALTPSERLIHLSPS